MFRSKFSWFSRFTLLPWRVLHAPEQSIAYCLTRYKPLQAKKSEKRGIHRPRIKKTLLRSKKPLVLGFRALPAARRDFASQKSDVRLLTWLHAAAFGVAVGAPPLPRPVVAQQLRASVPPPRPLSRAAVVRFCCFSAAGGRGSGASSYALCADGFASASVALSGLCALPFRFSALVAWGSRQACASFGAFGALWYVPPSRPEGLSGGRSRAKNACAVLAVVQQRTRVGSAP